MYVIFNVIIPTKLSMAQKKLIKELDKTDLKNSEEFKRFEKFL